jgi:hypothetical protein
MYQAQTIAAPNPLIQDANPLCFVYVVFGGEYNFFFVSTLSKSDFSHVLLPNGEPRSTIYAATATGTIYKVRSTAFFMSLVRFPLLFF